MQNYLTTRYRRVHDKIKDVRVSALGGKFSKVRSIRQINVETADADNRKHF